MGGRKGATRFIRSMLTLLVWCSVLGRISYSNAFIHYHKTRQYYAGNGLLKTTTMISVPTFNMPAEAEQQQQTLSSYHFPNPTPSGTTTNLYAKTRSKSSTAFKTKKKNSGSGGKRFGRNKGSLTEDELSEHVAARYRNGRDAKVASRGIVDSSSSNNIDQAQYLKELNLRPSLVLNADYQPLSYLPLSLWSWQDSVKAIFSGKVVVVDVYPDITIRAANLEIALPSVIALVDYVPHLNSRPAFTRRNVFLRDEYKCQYCNNRFHTADLSLDHVHPRCMGGQLNWENAVTSCLKCNGRKGSLQVSELREVGMRLVREPRCPNQMELAAKAARMVPRRVHPTWKPFLGIARDVSRTGKKVPTTGKEAGDEEYIDDRYFEESM